MASVRRFNGATQSSRCASVPSSSLKHEQFLQDWSRHKSVAEAPARVESLQRQRARLPLPGQLAAAHLAAEATRIAQERDEKAAEATRLATLEQEEEQNKRALLLAHAQARLEAASYEARLKTRQELEVQAALALRAQILQREAAGEEARHRAAAERRVGDSLRCEGQREQELRDLQQRRGLAQLREELRQQAAEARSVQEQRRLAEINVDKERAEAAVAKARAEDVQNLVRKSSLQANVREALGRLLEAQTMQRAEEERSAQEHAQAAACYNQTLSERGARMLQLRRSALELRERRLQQVAQELSQRQAEAQELEDLHLLLQMEEVEALTRLREEAALRQRLEARAAALRDCEADMQRLELQRQQAQAAEAAWAADFCRRRAEEERLETLTKERRRLRLLEHKRELEQLLQERQEHTARERELAREELLKAQEEEAGRSRIIEEECSRLLREHSLSSFEPVLEKLRARTRFT